MIIKNDSPILEYDDSSKEVIAPDHDWTAERLPECLELFAKHGLAPSRLINVHATEDKNSFLSLLAGKKGAPGADFRVLPPLILNETDKDGNFVRTARHAAIYEEEHKDCFIS